MPRIRLIPATIATASLLLGVKLLDITRGTDALVGRVSAVEENGEKAKAAKTSIKPSEKLAALVADDKKEKAEAAKKEAAAKKAEEAKNSEGKDEKEKKGECPPAEQKKADNIPTKKNPISENAGDTVDRRYTQVEVELLENLSRRRDELNHWEENIQIKEEALNATEKRINDKIEQIDTMKKQVGELLAQYNEKEDAKIRSLVKIYEAMKPGDAARIFDEVEMPILLIVIDKMAEKKAAPILASMDPKKAKQITVQLAEQRRINTTRLGLPGGAAAVPGAAAPAAR